jgi:hypothetical protein
LVPSLERSLLKHGESVGVRWDRTKEGAWEMPAVEGRERHARNGEG